MDVFFRIYSGVIMVLFVFGPIAIAIGALIVHLWRRRGNADTRQEQSPRSNPQDKE